MAASAAAGVQMVAARPCISASQGIHAARVAVSRTDCMLSTTATFPKISCSWPLDSKRNGVLVRAISGESGRQGLPIDLRGNSNCNWYDAKYLLSVCCIFLVGLTVQLLAVPHNMEGYCSSLNLKQEHLEWPF
jgi:enoyl-[acyl-carrier protein] reductase I